MRKQRKNKCFFTRANAKTQFKKMFLTRAKQKQNFWPVRKHSENMSFLTRAKTE